VPKLKIIQVGDVHYPGWGSIRSPIDDKDDHFSPEMKTAVQTDPLQVVLDSFSSRVNLPDVSLIAFMGDITTYGNQDAMRHAFWHLDCLCRNTLSINSETYRRIAIVPGNHDVFRPEAAEVGATRKFKEFNKQADLYGWLPPPVEDINWHTISVAKYNANIALLNTSLGCWELHQLPKALRPSLNGKQKIKESDYYGQLDTPYIHSKSLSSIDAAIQDGTISDMFILIGHHNILQQSIPRVSPYAELLNSGQFRHALINEDISTIYLHGHIHCSEISMITDPDKVNARLLSICAPEFKDGFNELTFYINDNKRATAVRIDQFRVQLVAGQYKISNKRPLFISLIDPSFLLSDTNLNLAHDAIQGSLQKNGGIIYWDVARSVVQLSAPIYQNDELVEDAMVQLHAYNKITIAAVDRSRENWRIQSYKERPR
jgi:Calcineurin-like phosphoesterase